MQRTNFKHPFSPVDSCRSLLLSLLLVALFSIRAMAAEALTELPVNIQEGIKTVCLPVQYQQGAIAYSECIDNEVIAYTGGKTSSPDAHLSFDDKYAVQQACSSAGEKTSSTYQICLRQQVAELNALPVPVIDDLSDDEQYALQQTCFEAQSRLGAGPYRHCINRALTELRRLPAANFTGLSQVAQNGIQLRCSANHQDVVDYRKCLIEAVGGVTAPSTTAARTITRQQRAAVTRASKAANESVPTTPTSTSASSIAPAEENFSTTVATSTNTASTSHSNTPTKTLTNVDLAAARPVQNTTGLSDNQSVAQTVNSNAASTKTTVVNESDSDADGSNDDATANDSVADNEVVPVEDTPPLDFRDRAVEAWIQLKSTVLALEGINRMLLLCALALPVLLMFAWGFTRRRRTRNTRPLSQRHNTDLLNRVHPDFNTDEQEQLKHRLDAEAEEFFGIIDDADDTYDDYQAASSESNRGAAPHDRNSNFPDTRAVTEPFESTQQEPSMQKLEDSTVHPHPASPSEPPAATRIATKPEIAAAAAIQKGPSDHADDPSLSKAADRGAFATWLASADPDDQLSYAIEFLIYWIAYGDERYDPALKEVLFQLQEPDDRDLIKRWVLKHDVIAFRDTISWLQNNSDSTQRRQIIDLLMVVLINEGALTPVQNTILRFLGDAFGIGNAGLDAQYREAFGSAMAPLPRADKPKWWQRQPATASLRWDARAVANESLDLQYRVRLGLELDGPVDEEAVVKGFRRAARRCHPERFDTLTERERELAEMQFEKFEDARDYLLGVNAMND